MQKDMIMKDTSIAEAKSRFSDLVSRAAAGERFLIRRRGRPMAALISVEELKRLERMSEMARKMALALGQDAELLAQIEAGEAHPIAAAFGLWRDEQDLSGLTEEIYANRRHQGSKDGAAW